MHSTLAAGTAATLIGGFGTGGIAAVLFTALVLGTRKNSEKTLKKNAALTLALCAGTVLIAAAGIWGIPDGFTRGAMEAAKIGHGQGPLGDVEPTAVAVVLVLIAYFVKLNPRAAAVTGLVMATVFGGAGGAWTMVAIYIRDFFLGFA
ncbi:hypothetical protein [Streptomyces sp. NPDC051561]|uniref:hypothetical protein n=1 Tax=Streptomyces sp. NPDC051561 TaxID=3365658 RepID=UPI00378A70CD